MMKNKLLLLWLFVLFSTMIITGCDNHRKREREYTKRFAYVNKIIQRERGATGNVNIMIKVAESFLRDYPDKIEPYFYIMAIKGTKIGIDNDDFRLTKDNKKVIDEIIVLGEKLLNVYQQMDKQAQKKYRQYIVLYAMSLDQIGHYQRSVYLFEKYYDKDKYLGDPTPTLRYAVIQYAHALAKVGRLGEANDLYIASFKVNMNDLVLVRAWIKFNADFDSEDGAADWAINYMNKMGITDGILYQLCRTYEQYNNIKKAINCYHQLLTFNEKNDVYTEFIKHADQYIKAN